MSADDEKFRDLLPYCQTDRQREFIQARLDYGSHRKAAEALGVHKTRLDDAIKRVKKYATLKAYAPDHGIAHPLPEPLVLHGTTHGVHAEKGEIMTWYKTHVDKEKQLAIVREAVQACLEDLPAESVVPCPGTANTDLLNLHVLTDLHMGQLSWGDETRGDDWDTSIAEGLLTRWWANAIERAPNAHTGILCQLGDLLHADNLEAMTPQSGHRLDVDSRMAAVVRVVVRSLRRIMRMMLEKYPHVHVVMSDANHDPTGAIWMREFMAELYREEPRVTVDTSPDTFNCYEWGRVSLFFHHGHKVKAESVAKVCAERFREIYGRTVYSYCHTGHLHHLSAKDHGIAIVTQHPTMAAKDNHAASHGYASARFASIVTYSATQGKVGEVIVTPEMVEDSA